LTTSRLSIALDLTESRLPLTVISLAWPVLLEQSLVTAVGLVNTIMVGHLGATSLTAVGLGTQAVQFPQVVVNGLAVGATAVIARRIGAGNPREASVAVHQSLFLAALVALIFVPTQWILARQLMLLLRARPDAADLGSIYIHAAAPGMIPGLIMMSANAAMRGSGNTRRPMMAMMTTNVTNALVGYVLIYGAFGMPALGVQGAGIASAIGWLVGCTMSLTFLARGVGALRLSFGRAFLPHGSIVGSILKVGFPSCLEQAQTQIAFILFSVIFSALGTKVYAAQTVALRVENIAFMPGFGLGVAATTLVGQALGAGRPDLAERAGRLAQWYAVAIMSAAGLIMGVFRYQLMAIFIDDVEVISIGVWGILLYAFSLPFMGTSNCLAGSLRGAGDTRVVLISMTASCWLVRLPLAYFLAYGADLGAIGAWTAAVLDLATRGVLMWWRFSTGRWKTIRV